MRQVPTQWNTVPPVDGWAAANSYYDPNRETLAKLIKGWAEANDYVVANSDAAMQALQKAHYSQTPIADIEESFKAQKMFTSQEWKKMYADGTVTKWLQQTTDFFMANAGVKDFTPADKYFDPSLYLKTIA
jgi:NitT/TauT family transport system substrate-binding protein